MSFLLIGATREELEAALASAHLEVLAEGSPYDLALHVSEHRGEKTEFAFVFPVKLARGPVVEWCEAGREILQDSGGELPAAEWERLVGLVVLEVIQLLRSRVKGVPA
jgi:hypothetical protein